MGSANSVIKTFSQVFSFLLSLKSRLFSLVLFGTFFLGEKHKQIIEKNLHLLILLVLKNMLFISHASTINVFCVKEWGQN